MHRVRLLAPLLLPLAPCLAAGELLSNPGFEDRLAPWTTGHTWYIVGDYGLSDVEVAEGEGRQGGAALRITGADNRGIAMQALAAYPDRFRVTGWLRCQDLGNAAAVLQVEWIGEGGWIGASPVGSVTGDAEWTFVESTVEAPEEAISAYVEVLTTAPNSGTAWFDDISFVDTTTDAVAPGPVHVRADGAAGAQGALALDWSDHAAEADVLAYQVFVSTEPFVDVSGMTPAARVGRLRRAVEIGGLVDGRAYHVAVVAVDQDGNRDPNVETVEMTPVDRRSPRPIVPWTEPLVAPTPAVAVHWRPDLLRESVIYQVLWRPPGGEVAGRLPADGGQQLAALTGLPARSDIEVAVVGIDSAGNASEPSWVAARSGDPSPGAGQLHAVEPSGAAVPDATVTLHALSAAGSAVALAVAEAPGRLASGAMLIADPTQVSATLPMPDTAQAVPPVWAAWGTDQVFRDSTPPEGEGPEVLMLAGRGEAASMQVVIRPDGAMADLRAWATDLTAADGSTIPSGFVTTNFVGYVRVEANSKATPVEDLVREAPADFPDELLVAPRLNVSASECQPVFVRVDVPLEAQPGIYRGSLWLSWEGGSVAHPLTIEVLGYDFPDRTSLLVTNWFNSDVLATRYGLEPWGEDHWAMLRRVAQMMADHHQNVVMTPLSLVAVFERDGGEYAFDFSGFDRWVTLFDEAGVSSMIELSHVGGRATSEWESPEFIFHDRPATRLADGSATTVPVGTFCRALQEHLRERGWLERSALHIADEPIAVNEASWRRLSRAVHEAAPDLRRIDAIHVTDLDGDLEIWVPQLNFFDQAYEELRAKREAGVAEIWFYIAWVPQGPYPNRLLDMETIRTRLIHWMNYLYEAPGYLHWGLNWWDIEMGHFSPGDEWVIWPGEDGPNSSLRYEAQREGIEDYELLVRLEAKRRAAGDPDPRARSVEYARRLIRSITDYSVDPRELATVHAQLAREVAD